MNKIIIAGRMTKEPEPKTTNSGTEVCNFTVAVDRRIKKGEEKVADFIECTAWGKTGVFVSTYFHKGDGITVDGRMESRKWQDKDGNNRVSWGVNCDNVEFALGKGNGGFTPLPAGVTYTDTAATADFTEIADDGALPF